MKKLVSYLFILTFFIFYSSCTKNDSTPTEPGDAGGNNSGTIQVGETIEVITGQAIGTSGGKITVNKPGDKIDGLEITVPSNAFTQTKTFKVSYSDIKSHQLGQYFSPVSPMISISYEGGYADKPIEVKIPIKLPKDNFAMGFFYDEKTGKLEGLPIESLDSNYITVSTRTFSQSSSLGKSRGINDANSVGEMIISSISESSLKSQAVIASGFQPGVDDWEFINYGSYIAPGGHCAGQSMTMMWYYYEKKLKGEQSLFHMFDEVNEKTNPGKLWQDNPLGYRFASTIQNDFNFDGWVTSLEWKQNFPGLTFKAFAASILVTGEPQFVLIRNSAGEGGHAMVVYKVNFNEGKLYIADPNYPNNRVAGDGSESIRTIDYVGGVLKPYETGLTAGANSTTMDQIGYFGKTTYIDWGQMAKRWTEVENKTIGNDRFPVCQIKVQNDNDKELVDQYNIEKDTIKFYSKGPASANISGTDYLWLQVFDDKGNKISKQADEFRGIPVIPLKAGSNKLGIYISGSKNGNWCYIDFRWINVNYSTLKIDPDPIVGIPDDDIKITALTNGTAPRNAKYVWNFGDQTAEVTKNNDSIVVHKFENEGEYTVDVKLYDNSNNKLVGTANAKANITKEGELLNLLHTMNNFGVGCSFNFLTPQGYEYSQGISFFKYDKDTLKWNSTSFNYDDVDEEDFDGQGFKTNYYHYVSGTVSSDGKTILEIKTKYVAIYYRYYEWAETHTEEMNFTNVPIMHYPGSQDWGGEYDDFQYQLEEDEANAHVSLVKWTWEEKDNSPLVYNNIKDFWQPLIISFRKD